MFLHWSSADLYSHLHLQVSFLQAAETNDNFSSLKELNLQFSAYRAVMGQDVSIFKLAHNFIHNIQ